MSARSGVRNWRVRVEFKREDCWVGVFWRTEQTTRGTLTTWWVCLLPMLPIVIQHGRYDPTQHDPCASCGRDFATEDDWTWRCNAEDGLGDVHRTCCSQCNLAVALASALGASRVVSVPDFDPFNHPVIPAHMEPLVADITDLAGGPS